MASAPPAPRAPDDLRAYVPRVLSLWGEGPAAIGGRVVHGALVSADVSGFTRLSERLAGHGREGAEELTELLNTVFDGMVEAANAQGGDVLAFGGDALFLLFDGEDPVPRACRACVAIRDVVGAPLSGRLSGPVRLRISQGIHVGDVPLAVVDAGRLELLAAGPVVSGTVRCEAVANAGQIVLSDAAAAQVPRGWLGAQVEGGRALRRATAAAEPWTAPESAVADPGRFLSDAVREMLQAGGGGEHRRVTVAFVSLPGMDEVARLGADALAEALGGVAAVVSAATREAGVHWLASDVQEDGLKMILTAGAPSGGRDDEGRMLRCLRAIVEASPRPLRIGVNTGPVFAGELGSRRRGAYTVMGDAVNIAARLMGVAAPGQIVASRAVTDASRTGFALDPLPPLSLKGKTTAVEAAVLGEEVSGAAVAGPTLPFVGRSDVMEALAAAAAACADGAGRPVELVGPPGIGKTRVLAEFAATLGGPVARAAGLLHLRERPYVAVRPLLRELLAIPRDAGREDAGAALAEAVARSAPDLAPVLPFIAIPFDAAVPETRAYRETAPAFRRSRLRRGVLALLERVLPPTGAILIEDAHWLDEASQDLVGAMMRLSRRRGWLVLASRHPGARIAAQGVEPVVVELDPLSAEATATLAEAMLAPLGSHAADEAVLLAERSAGNPLFLAELGASAAEHGGVAGLPDSIEDVVTERIDTLRPRERRLLREAAVLGTRVDLDVLAGVLDDDAVTGATAWAAMAEFVDHGEDRIVFRHALFHEVAYGGLSYRRRREMHLRAGLTLERGTPRPESRAEVLSLHFHEAGDHPRAWRYSLAAAERARERLAAESSADFYERALANAAHLEVPEEDLARVAETMGDVCETAARYERASRGYGIARRLRAEPVRRADLLRKEGVLRERTARYTEALRWYGRARREAAAADRADAVRAEIDLGAAGVRYRQGRYADGVRLCEAAVGVAERLGDARLRATAYFLLDLGYTYLRRPESAEYRGRALPIYEEIGDLVGQARTLNNLGAVAYFDGRWDEALERFRAYRERSERAGDIVNAATAMNNIGEILSDQGQVQEAVQLFREARRIWRGTGYAIGVALATCNLGRAEARLGAADEAVSLLEEAASAFRAIGVPEFAALAEAWRAEALLLARRPDEALGAIASVTAAAREGVEDHAVLAVAHRTAGLAHLALGDLDAARASLFRARNESEGTPYEVAMTRIAEALVAEAAGGSGDEDRAEAVALLGPLGAGAALTLPTVTPV